MRQDSGGGTNVTDPVIQTIRAYDESEEEPREGIELLELIDTYTRDATMDYADVHHIMDEIAVDDPDDIPPYRFTAADDEWRRRFSRATYQKEPELIYENQETGDTLSFFHGYGENYAGRWKFPEDHEASRTLREMVRQLPDRAAASITRIQEFLQSREEITYEAIYHGNLHDLRQELERYHAGRPDGLNRYSVGEAEVRFQENSVAVTLPDGCDAEEPVVLRYLDDLTLVEHRVRGDTRQSFIGGTPIMDPALARQQEQEIDREQDD